MTLDMGRRGHERPTLVLLAIGAAAFAMLQTLVAPVLGIIQADLDATEGTAAWILIAYLLSAAVATPVLGRLGDLAGKERILRAALAALSVGCLMAAVAPNVEFLLAGRVLQGAGGALFPLAFGIVRDQFPRERASAAIGVLSGVLAFGGGLGLVLAGPLEALMGWRALFWGPMLVSGGIAAIVSRIIPAGPRQPDKRVDLSTAALLALWLVCLLIPISMGSRWGWESVTVWSMFGFALLAFAFWVFVDLRSPHAVIDLRLMQRRSVWVANLVAFLLGAGMFGVLGFLPLLLQTPPDAGYGFDASVITVGLLLMAMPLAQAVSSFASGRLGARLPLREQLALGSLLMALASAAFGLAHGSYWQIVAGATVYGLGLGLAYATVTNIVISAVPSGETGAVSGLNANVRTIGGAVGVAVTGAIVNAQPGASGYPMEAGYTAGFITLGLMSLAAAAATFCLLPSGRSRPGSEQWLDQERQHHPAGDGAGDGAGRVAGQR